MIFLKTFMVNISLYCYWGLIMILVLCPAKHWHCPNCQYANILTNYIAYIYDVRAIMARTDHYHVSAAVLYNSVSIR